MRAWLLLSLATRKSDVKDTGSSENILPSNRKTIIPYFIETKDRVPQQMMIPHGNII